MNKYVVDHLMAVIKTMREACDDAERAIGYEDSTPLQKTMRVFHIFTWAWANASTSVEGVVSHIDDAHTRERILGGHE